MSSLLLPNYPVAQSKLFVVPLFSGDSEGREFIPGGSGVLVTYGSRSFLCTAGHVVGRRTTHSIWVGGVNPPMPISSSFTRNRTADTERDPIDFAALELSHREVGQLSAFFSFYNLCTSKIDLHALNCSTYKLIGYVQRHNTQQEMSLPANALGFEVRSCRKLLSHDRQRRKEAGWYIAATHDPGSPLLQLSSDFKGFNDFSGLSGGAWLCEEPHTERCYVRLAGISLAVVPLRRGRVQFIGLGARAMTDMLCHWFSGLRPPSWWSNG